MKKKERRRLEDAAPVVCVCVLIDAVLPHLEAIGLNRAATMQVEKVRRWNGEALRGFGIMNAKDVRQTSAKIHTIYETLVKSINAHTQNMPESLNSGATVICVDALLADALTGRREIRCTPAIRYLAQTWETLTLMFSTGEDETAVAGTRIYLETHIHKEE